MGATDSFRLGGNVHGKNQRAPSRLVVIVLGAPPRGAVGHFAAVSQALGATALASSVCAAGAAFAHVHSRAFAELVEIVRGNGFARVDAFDGGHILVAHANGDVAHRHERIGDLIGRGLDDLVGDDIDESALGIALDGRGGDERLVAQGVNNKTGVDKLVGKQIVALVLKTRPDTDGSGGLVNQIVHGHELARGNDVLLGAVVRLNRHH